MDSQKAHNKNQEPIFEESPSDSQLSAPHPTPHTPHPTPHAASIVIITKDTKRLLKDLLDSVRHDESLQPCIKEIIVVDNASIDGTGDLVTHKFPEVVYIRNDRNIGFAAAANVGMSRTSAEFILFLNSDTLLIEGEIVKMLGYMEENKDVGICGPQLVYPDMRPQRSFAYTPVLLFEIIPRSFLEFVFQKKYPAKRSTLYALHAALEVDSLIGAAIMVRKEVLERLGGFDERFFFFLEETDVCVRARHNGQKVMFFPGTKVIHHQGKTVGKNWVQGRIEYNISLYKFIRKHHAFTYSTLFEAIRLFKSLLFLIIFSIVPIPLVNKRMRRRYIYYFKLLLWHLKECPDNAGLRSELSSC